MSLANTKIDINCDLGEIDPTLQLERSIMLLIDRCNIAAGGHAGDDQTMKETMLLAIEANVKVGIHPSFPDISNFGRVKLNMPEEELIDSIKEQISNFGEIAYKNNLQIDHIKAHGALYHYLAEDKSIAEKYLLMIKELSLNTKLLVPPNSQVEKLAVQDSIEILIEAFADRRYTVDGKLQSRSIEGSVLHNQQDVVNQVEAIIKNQGLIVEGKFVALKANSICVHSDTTNSISILQAIKNHFS